MTVEIQNTVCRTEDIAAYLDGELLPDAEIAFEMHTAVCSDCRSELNLQKNLLRELDMCLTTGELELPRDFAKTVVANAESRVSGLRLPRERYTAAFLCLGLLITAVVALGPDLEATLRMINSVVTKAAVVAGSISHFVFDAALGVAIILRALGTNAVSGSGIAAVSIGILAVLSLFVLSRLLLRPHRA